MGRPGDASWASRTGVGVAADLTRLRVIVVLLVMGALAVVVGLASGDFAEVVQNGSRL